MPSAMTASAVPHGRGDGDDAGQARREPGARRRCRSGSPRRSRCRRPASASECQPPAAMATTSRSPAGTAVWPSLLSPQAVTVPSAVSASECQVPAATATTFRRPGGNGGLAVAVRAPRRDGAVRADREPVPAAGGGGEDVGQPGPGCRSARWPGRPRPRPSRAAGSAADADLAGHRIAHLGRRTGARRTGGRPHRSCKPGSGYSATGYGVWLATEMTVRPAPSTAGRSATLRLNTHCSVPAVPLTVRPYWPSPGPVSRVTKRAWSSSAELRSAASPGRTSCSVPPPAVVAAQLHGAGGPVERRRHGLVRADAGQRQVDRAVGGPEEPLLPGWAGCS